MAFFFFFAIHQCELAIGIHVSPPSQIFILFFDVGDFLKICLYGICYNIIASALCFFFFLDRRYVGS